jgi:hypothetical protein
MRRALATLALCLAACSPTEDECRDLCAATAEYRTGSHCSITNCDGPGCTAQFIDKCVDRCVANASAAEVDHGFERCADSAFNSCSAALCCLGFYYSDDSMERNCE